MKHSPIANKKWRERAKNLDAREKHIVNMLHGGIMFFSMLVMLAFTALMIWFGVKGDSPAWFFAIVFWMMGMGAIMVAQNILLILTLALTVWFCKD